MSGKFVFTITEGYLIENGKIGAPVKGATLIGAGSEAASPRWAWSATTWRSIPASATPAARTRRPVGVGQPTLRIDALTVGGTATSPGGATTEVPLPR